MNDFIGQEMVASSESQEDRLNVCGGKEEILVSPKSQTGIIAEEIRK